MKVEQLSVDNRPVVTKVPKAMAMPSFPKVEGGRDFDEEVEDRIRLTHAYNSQIADSNTRALSARGAIKTAEVESVATVSPRGGGGSGSKGKDKRKQERAINEKVLAIASNGGNSNSYSRNHQSLSMTRIKFSMAKHRQQIVKLLMH